MDKNKEKRVVLILIFCLVVLDQIVKIIMAVLHKNIYQDLDTRDNLTNLLIGRIALIFLVRYINSNNMYIKFNSRILLGFAIAGIIGNSIDRITNGYVVNYIHIPNFIDLNLAYIYILITWIGMAAILTIYTKDRIDERKAKNNVKKVNSEKHEK